MSKDELDAWVDCIAILLDDIRQSKNRSAADEQQAEQTQAVEVVTDAND